MNAITLVENTYSVEGGMKKGPKILPFYMKVNH